MVELVGVHRLEEAHLVHHLAEMRQKVGHPRAAFAVLREIGLRPEHLWHATDEGELLALQQGFWAGQVVQFAEFGLVVEELQLGGPAGHVQVDDVLGPSGKVRRARPHGVQCAEVEAVPDPFGAASLGGRPARAAAQYSRHGDAAETRGAFFQKMPARDGLQTPVLRLADQVVHVRFHRF